MLQKLAQGLYLAFFHLKAHGLKVSQTKTWRVMEAVAPVPLRNGCWKKLEVQWQATYADFQHPTSALLQPYLSSHTSWSLCVTLTDTFCLMLAQPEVPSTCLVQGCCSAWLGPMLGSGMASSVTPACRSTGRHGAGLLQGKAHAPP